MKKPSSKWEPKLVGIFHHEPGGILVYTKHKVTEEGLTHGMLKLKWFANDQYRLIEKLSPNRWLIAFSFKQVDPSTFPDLKP